MKKNKLIKALSNQLMERSIEVGALKAENKLLNIQNESSKKLLEEAGDALGEIVGNMMTDNDLSRGDIKERITKFARIAKNIPAEEIEKVPKIEQLTMKIAEDDPMVKEYMVACNTLEVAFIERLKSVGIETTKINGMSMNLKDPTKWVIGYIPTPKTT